MSTVKFVYPITRPTCVYPHRGRHPLRTEDIVNIDSEVGLFYLNGHVSTSLLTPLKIGCPGAGVGHGSEQEPRAEADLGLETEDEGEKSTTDLGGETGMQVPTDETRGTEGVMTHATETRETAAAARLAKGTGVGMKEIGRGAGTATPSTIHETELANREAREGELIAP